MTLETIRGKIRGNTIELEHPTGLPDGQDVSVTVSTAEAAAGGLRQAFGAWSDATDIDDFLDGVRRDRNRREINE